MFYKGVDVSGGLPNPYAFGLNETDQIVGGSLEKSGSFSAFIELSLGTAKLIKPPGDTLSCLNAINDHGVAVGTWTDVKGLCHGFIYASGALTPLDPVLGSSWSTANDISDRGHIVGAAVFDMSADASHMHAFLYDPAASPMVRDLGVLDGRSASNAIALDDIDQVVGVSTDWSTANYRPFIWSGGAIGELTGEQGVARDINDIGHVVGASEVLLSIPGDPKSYIWRSDGLETIPLNGMVNSINTLDQVVGNAVTEGPFPVWYGFLYEGGVSINLNSVAVGLSGIAILQAYDINDNGHITARGVDKSWLSYALLLSPAVIEPLSLFSLPPAWKYLDPYLTQLLAWMSNPRPDRGPPPAPPVRPPTHPSRLEPPAQLSPT